MKVIKTFNKYYAVLDNNKYYGIVITPPAYVLNYSDTPVLCHLDGDNTNLGCGNAFQYVYDGWWDYTSDVSKFGTYAMKMTPSTRTWADWSGFPWEPTTIYTVEFWFMHNGSGNTGNVFCWNRLGGDKLNYISINRSGTNTYTVGDDDNPRATCTLDDTTWHHFAFTYDGNGKFRGFVDGVFKVEYTKTTYSNAGYYTPDVNATASNTAYYSEYVIHYGIRYVNDFTPPTQQYIIQV